MIKIATIINRHNAEQKSALGRSSISQFVAVVLLGLVVAEPAAAVSYGIFDSRGLAMGGATVAASKYHSAQYYNPALLALHDTHESKSRDARFVFPDLVLQYSNNLEEVADVVEADIDTTIENAVVAFNVDASVANATAIANGARELRDALGDLGNQDYVVDGFIGMSVSEPSKFQGGGFFFGVRTLGAGSSTIPQSDLDLIDRYIDALDLIASGGDPADLPPDLIDANGNLIDPNDRIESSGQAGGLIMSEWGVAMSKRFDVWGQGLAVGVTPKLLRVDAYRENVTFTDRDADLSESELTHLTGNADIGVALELFENYRIGLAVKDIIKKEFDTANDLRLKLAPRPRMGLAYMNSWFTFGVDMDLVESEPLANEAPTKEMAVGMEVTPLAGLDLRVGYREDMAGERAPVTSYGVELRGRYLTLELGYSESEEIRGGSIQFGFIF